MAMIDRLHQRGVGVLFDWVPSHFPTDAHGLYEFDGTHLYEHADPRQGYHPDWNSAIFNYGRNEVRSFLISSAMCWLDRYPRRRAARRRRRVDALPRLLAQRRRVDPEHVRRPREPRGDRLPAPVQRGRVRRVPRHRHPRRGVDGVAERQPPDLPRRARLRRQVGHGLDARHVAVPAARPDPSQVAPRRDHVPLGVHGQRELRAAAQPRRGRARQGVAAAARCRATTGRRFANLRLLYAMQWFQPGKKLLFMGCELATWTEWNHEATLDWGLHDAPMHEGVRLLVADLNALYRDEPAMHRGDCATVPADPGCAGSRPTTPSRACSAGCASTRRARHDRCSWWSTPPRRRSHNYRLGVPTPGTWDELLNTDAADVRRQRHGQRRRRRHRPARLPRLPPVDRGHAPPARRRRPRPVTGDVACLSLSVTAHELELGDGLVGEGGVDRRRGRCRSGGGGRRGRRARRRRRSGWW